MRPLVPLPDGERLGEGVNDVRLVVRVPADL